MNNFILSISADQYSEKLNVSEALEFGGQMLLLGMGAVFSVLAIIWVVLTVFKAVFARIENKKKPVPVVQEVAAPARASVNTAETEIVAVIAAAIAMAESESGNNVKFRVVSFKRK